MPIMLNYKPNKWHNLYVMPLLYNKQSCYYHLLVCDFSCATATIDFFQKTMKKTFESGASKRRKLRTQHEELAKMPKLTSFLMKSVAEEACTSGTTTPEGVTKQLIESSSVSDSELSLVTEPISEGITEPLVESSSNSEVVTEPTYEIVTVPSFDPALWNLSNCNEKSTIIQNGPQPYQNLNADFSKSARVYQKGKSETVTRFLSKSVFTRVLHYGEHVTREWLLYSESEGSVYCFACRLFSVKQSTFSTCGFNDWKHMNLINAHECGPEHAQAMVSYSLRQSEMGIDSELLKQMHEEQEYWRKVLQRIVSVIKFLASRGMAFRGENQTLGSNQNGNYLGILELLSQYDPFLDEHLKKFCNAGKGTTSYLSANICEEFISLIGEKVHEEILKEIKEAKYYSISVDSTPDVCHLDQLSFTIRYMHDGNPIERFLEFIPIYGHGSEYLATTVLEYLKRNNIPISDCRGQSYDNASNMAGHYSGLQAILKSVNSAAIFLPCVGHSLNLVGKNAAQCCPDVDNYFSFVQRLFTFFSASTQ